MVFIHIYILKYIKKENNVYLFHILIFKYKYMKDSVMNIHYGNDIKVSKLVEHVKNAFSKVNEVKLIYYYTQSLYKWDFSCLLGWIDTNKLEKKIRECIKEENLTLLED